MTQQDVHDFRKMIDGNIQIAEKMLAKTNQKWMRELSLVRTKLQEAKMWAGKILEVMGSELPAEFRDKAEMGDIN